MALFDEKDEKLVKTFLFNKIEKECDADPAIMADYILVTLQNEMSESDLKEHCRTDLTEFFGDKTSVFVDTLFDALAKKQYLPRAPSAAPVVPALTTPSTTLSIKGSGSRNNGAGQPTRGDSWESGSGDRHSSSRRRSRSPVHDRHRRTRESRSRSRERRADRESHHIVNASLLDGPLEASHPGHGQHYQEQHYQEQQQQQQQMPQRRRKPCFEFMRKGKCQRGDACTYMHVTAEQAHMMGMQVPSNMMTGAHAGGQFMMGVGGMVPQQPGPNGPLFMGMPPTHAQQQPHHQQQQQQPQRPQQQQQRAGRAGGAYDSQQSYSATGVFVSNIPPESLDEAAVRESFGKFGEITSVRMDYTKQCATIAFSDSSAQQRALNSPEAPFNNRFVRVHRAFSSAVDRAATEASNGHRAEQPPVWRPKSAAIKMAEMIEKYVEQQRDLMKKLTTTKDMPPATRKIIMDSIKQIQQRIDEAQKPKASSGGQSAVAMVAEAPSAGETDLSGSADEQQQQQQLDAVAMEKAALQNKLKALQEEAARLGMNTRKAAPRGRGGWAGAAAAASRSAMTLDKRPRTIVLRNVGQAAAEQIPSELGRFGEIEHIDKLDDHTGPPFTYTVKYKARWEAEKAVKAVTSLDLFSDVGVDWDQQ
ncbi:hypothetical protein LPJ61_001701 [Coemansia biformis]|uniref:RNA-binding domain-containing protein n=1 Tax=Coemansia biformis TaxID=1286918 RepID=A0A9W7YFG8_9FUNG|nr:hypothetical protein LPJ61_001701 [Coemansia biformis]